MPSTITGMSVGAATEIMDVSPNAAHQLLDPGPNQTAYGLWLDGPPHPYRDNTGSVYLALKHSENYRFRIPNWANPSGWELQGPTMLSTRDVVESHYNNRHWVYGHWSTGSTVYALTHHEWYQNMYTSAGVPGFNALNYPSGNPNFNRQWVNGIGLATSTNGGATFTIAPNDNSTRLVVIPEPWGIQSASHMFGFFHPSNIVQEGSYYYAAIEQRSVVNPAAGNCICGVSLIRTTNLASTLNWEYWNGSGWTVISHATYQGNLSSQVPYRFFEQTNNFYASSATNSNMCQNLRYHVPTSQWLMFGYAGTTAQVFGYSTSATLANPQFTSVVGISNPNNSIFYPYVSVFDESAVDLNYQNIGNTLTVLTTGISFAKIQRSYLTITVDTPVTYSISPSTTNLNEGQSVTFTITTSGFGSGTLYWTNAGTTTGADFTDGQNSGSVTITGDSGSFTRTLSNDLTTEGTESIVMQLRSGSTSGTLVATSSTVTVNDTSVPAGATYSVTPSTSSVNEGGTVNFTITTTNFGTGTLYWSNSGTTVGSDFSDGSNSGSVAITNNSGLLSRTLVNDLSTEGSETIVFQLRTGSTSGTIVAIASTVTVTDTSTTPVGSGSRLRILSGSGVWIDAATASLLRFRDNASWVNKTGNLSGVFARNLPSVAPTWIPFTAAVPTYAVTPASSTVNEGQSIAFNVATTNVGSTTLYWTNSGTTNAADFTDNLNSGSVTITNNAGVITRTLASDLITEGTETIVIQLRTGSTNGPVVATATAVSVNDTPVPSVPTVLTMNRNNLDFVYLPDQTSSYDQVSLDVRATIDMSNFFNYATGGFDHIAFALDCSGEAGNNNPHCGPIYRNGRNLWVLGRGFFITRDSGVYSEIWNGTYNPVTNPITNTSGQVFNPLSGTYTVRIRAGYRAGVFANLMTITITSGVGIYGPVVFQGSAGIGWDWTGNHRVCMAAIAAGFVGPTPQNGCVEPSGPGSAYGGYIPFSDFSLNVY